MRDVNYGWLVRMCHANIASFFFITVYLHISRGLYYGSYRSPRIGTWVIGTIIFFLMMATLYIYKQWPKWILRTTVINCLPFTKARTKAVYRIGPHNIDVLSVLICGMLGDFWADKINNSFGYSIRFNIEQSISNSAYIHHLTYLFFNWGYSSYIVPKLVKKADVVKVDNNNVFKDRFNYRLSLFTFTSFGWIYDSFYVNIEGIKVKRVPDWIGNFITPIGLAHWIMQDGSKQKGYGIFIATNSFTYEECLFLSKILSEKYKLKTSVVKAGVANQWRIYIWKESMLTLVSIVKPYIIDEMKYKFKDFI